MERESWPKFTIEEMTLGDGEEVSAFLKRMHQDTYTNNDLGVTKEALGQRFERHTPEERKERLMHRLESPDNKAYVAKDGDRVIGMVAPRIEDGVRRVGALYVDQHWHGSGLAHDLCKKQLIGMTEFIMTLNFT